MTQDQILIAGAVGFALFAVLYLKKQGGAPVAAISPQPAQRQRDAGLSTWLGGLNDQAGWTYTGPGFADTISQMRF